MIVRFLPRHFRSPRTTLAAGHPPHIPVAECLRALESRYMFDAAGVATGAEAAVDTVAQKQAEQTVDNHLNNSGAGGTGQTSDASVADNADANEQLLEALAAHEPPAGRREVVFIDTSVEDYRTLIAGIDPSAEVVLLDATRDGVEQIVEVLAERSGIDAIHIVSHGSQAELRLGTARLTLDSMTGRYVDELAVFRQALIDEADLLVYGCDFGQGQRGQEAATTLAKITGSDVAASEDATGHATLGGDWDLELRAGSVETTAVLSFEAQANFMGLLATYYVRDEFSAPTYNGNDGSVIWNGAWQELGDGGTGAGSGLVSVSVPGEQLTFGGTGNPEVRRAVDLSQADSATLSLDYSSSGLLGLSQVTLEISRNGGAGWDVLATYDGILLGGTAGTSTFDISAWATADTQIRLNGSLVTVLAGYAFDNIEISYTVNDAPAGTDITVTTNEDTAHTFTTANFGFTDVDAGDSLSAVRIDTLPSAGTLTLSGVAVTAAQIIPAADITAGNLVFTPAANANGAGYVSFTFSVRDTGGPTFDAAPNTLTVDVTAVNDAPTGANTTVTTNEDTAHTFTTANFGFTDVDAGDSLSAVRIDTLPSAGTLTLSGVAVTAAQIIPAADITAGNLVFTPAANANGSPYASFSFSVRDTGGPTFDAAPNTLTVDVTAVNDAPTGANTTVTTNEDTAHTFTTANFGFTDVDAGDSLRALRIDTLPSAGTLTLSGVAVTAAQIITAADITAGNLVFTPAANANGSPYASFSFSVRDTGGPAFDTTPDTMTVNVAAVNDAPVNTVPGPQTVVENTALALSGVSVNDAEGNLSTVALSVANGTLTVTLRGGTTVSAGANGSADLTLSGTQADLAATLASLVYRGNYIGPDTLTVTATDSSRASDTDTIAITVIAVAPAGTAPPGSGGSTPEGSPSASGPAPSPDDSLPSEVGDGHSSKTITKRNTTAGDDRRVTAGASSARAPVVSSTELGSDENFIDRTSQDLGSKSPIAKETSANAPYSTLKANLSLEELNRLRDNMNHPLSLATLALSLGLSVGYAIWLLRGGALLSSLLSSLPAWRWIDPLPVLAHLRDSRDDVEGNEDSLQAVLKNAETRDQSKPIPPVEGVPSAQRTATGAPLWQPYATASLQVKAKVSV